MTTTAIDIETTASKLAAIPDFQETSRGLVNRRREMFIITTALVAREHLILHGNPGRAKSMTVDGVLMHLPDLSQFKTQAYKASPPEQFLGPISIEGMTHDEFVRIVKNRAPDCEVFFCDEVPRAPRAVLPAFQGMMVEREFDSGRGVERVPLMSFIGTSNHLPDDPELQAFFDRFALKLVVQSPASQQQFVDILKGALHRDRGAVAIPDELIVSKDELVALQAAVDDTHVPSDVLDAMGEMWANLLAEGIEPSIRRYVSLLRVMRAAARINGRDEVEMDDLQLAQHSLWTKEDEIEAVYKVVVGFASEWVKEKSNLLDAFTETLDRLGQIQALVASGSESSTHVTIDEVGSDGEKVSRDRSITDHALKVVNDQRALHGLIERHIAAASPGQDTAELGSALTQMGAGKEWIQDRIMGGLTL